MAQRIKGITIEIGGDVTKLDKALSSVNSKSKELQSELKGVNSLLKLDPGNVNLLKQKQDILNQSIATTSEKLNTLKNAQIQVQEQFEKGEITAEQYRDFQREIVATESKLKSLNKELQNFGSISAQQIAVAGKKVQDAGEKIESAGKKMTGTSLAIGGLETAAISVGSKFDSSMKQVAATMGITASEIQNGSESYKILENAAKACGETTKYSASEAAEALNYLALAGYDAKESAETLPKVLSLAAAGGLDLATASDLVTDAMAALGMETSELDKYIDQMAKTSQKSNTNVAQLGEATLTVAGTANMAGMSLETMNAELGILANNGIKGAEGGTHLRNIILSLTSPTDTASKALKELGINVLDSNGNVRDLNDIMADFNTKLDGLSDGKKTEIISSIFNKTDISAVNALIKGSGEEFANLKSQLVDCDGAAQDMADTMNSSFSGQLTLLKSQIEGVAINLSSILMPVLLKIISKISELFTWFSGLSDGTKKIIVIIASVVAVLSPVLIIVGKLVGSIGTIMTYGPRIISGISGITKVVGVVKTALTSLWTIITLNPITMIIAAVVALVAGFTLLWNKCEGFRNFWINLWENIKSICQSVIEGISTLFVGIIDFIINCCNDLKLFIENIIQAVKDIIETIVSFISENIIEPIKAFFMPLVEWFANLFTSIYNSLVSMINVAWGVIQGLWTMLMALFNVIITWIQNNVLNPIINAFSNAWNVVKNGASNAWEGIKNVFSSVASFFGNIFSNAWEKVKAVFSTGGKIFDGIKDSIASVFTTVVNKIISGINTVVAVPFNAVNKALNKIRNIEFLGISPFKNKWNENPLSVPKIPLLRTGGTIIGDGEAIMAEAGSPEMITMMNGKAIVRPLTNTDRKEVLRTEQTNNSNYTLYIDKFINNRQQDIQGVAEEFEYFRKRKEKSA